MLSKVLRLLANERTRNLSLDIVDAIDEICYYCEHHRPGEFFDCVIKDGSQLTARFCATVVLECDKYKGLNHEFHDNCRSDENL